MFRPDLKVEDETWKQFDPFGSPVLLLHPESLPIPLDITCARANVGRTLLMLNSLCPMRIFRCEGVVAEQLNGAQWSIVTPSFARLDAVVCGLEQWVGLECGDCT